MVKQVVDYKGIPVGILVPHDGWLSFMAVKYGVMELDGRRYMSAAEAREAIRERMARHEAIAA